ncbi:NADP-dependent oxidoreductase [Auraticoccus monumenti]|nr:NADP-dependent oxidoreductase [Auraticoccus monumenti]
MRAVTYDRFGGPEVLRLTDVPVPVVGPGEVRIRVRRAAVNPVDWKVMAGGLTGLMPHVFPIVPGWDVAGVVEAVGPDTPELAEGDEVLAYARKDWVQAGTFAEQVTFSVRGVARKPASLSWDEAAGLPLAGGTALRVLDALGVAAGRTVLVHAAAGGVGALATQIAVARGVRVIGTASETNHDFLRGLGAEPVVYGDGLADRVQALAPEGVDGVADLVGGVREPSLDVLADGGRLVSVADPGVQEHGGRWVWVRPDREQLAQLTALTEAGRLRVPVAEVVDLAEAARAMELSQQGHTRGKIVIRVSD